MKPQHLSVSQMDTLDKCGQQYAYRYIEKIVSPPGFAATRGKVTARSVEANLKHKMETGQLLPIEQVVQVAADALEAECQGAMMLDGDYAEMTIAQAKGVVKDQVVDLSKCHAEKVAPLIAPVGVEIRVELEPSEALPVKFVGVLDQIDGKRIRDTKTKTKAPPKNMADDSLQLTAYDLLYQARYHEASQGQALDVLWKTPGGKVDHRTLETTRNRRDLEVFVARAQAALKVIEAEVFLPAPPDHWVCSKKFCGYTNICPYFRDGRTRPTS